MEANKENIPKIETRIPLPLYPLPPLPIQLLKKKGKVTEKRQPLQTLAQYELPSTSNNRLTLEDSTIKIVKKLDTKSVTLRKKTEDLDSNNSIIIISDDEDADGRNIRDSFLDGKSQSPDNWIEEYNQYQVREYTDDLLSHLLESERPPTTVMSTPRRTRASLINWLMKVNALSFGNPGIVQSACWYLDSFLSMERVLPDNTQLFGVACYWIALKLHGKVMSSTQLTFIAGNVFTQAMLLDAEKRIIVQLGFPPHPVIPQDFIAYLVWWCDKERPRELEMAANFLCMSGMMVVKELSVVCPSVIACASVLTAGILLGRKNSVKRIHDCPVFKTAKKKSGSLFYTCNFLRKAVKTIADPSYEHKAPLDHYGGPPNYVAEHVMNVARRRFTKIDQATMT